MHKGKTFWLMGIAVIVACVLLGMLISTLFSGATVTVYPRQATLSAQTVQAGLDAPVGSLSYQLMSVKKTAQRSVNASGSSQVSTSAQGTITIYNAYSTAPQQLVANTRFQAPDGKIYRIHDKITVPGAKKNADSTLSPGTVQVMVYADAPGADYNRGTTQFTIPGFQGDPRYSKFHATADSISGGFVGTRPGVSDADMQNATGQMKQELASAFPAAVASQLPDGFVPVQGTMTIEYADVAVADAGSGKATLSQDATATEAIVRSADLANALAKVQVGGYNGEPVDFTDPAKLSLNIATSTPYSATSPTILIALGSDQKISWLFDADALKQALAGKNKADFQSIIKTFSPAISKATASLRPFWKTSFPQNGSQIQFKTASTD